MTEKMTKSERDDLARLARLRAKQARTEVDQREKVQLAEVEDLITAEFEARDEMWADAVKVAKEAERKANEVIVARCADIGIPEQFAPQVSNNFYRRSYELENPKRRAELRKRAHAQLTALTATAKTMIHKKLLEIETELITGTLETAEARAFLETMADVEGMMPALTLDDVGVKHWQPPTDAAAALLTPSSTADRKRKQVLRALEADPGATTTRIAALAGVDRKTAAKYISERNGEIPNQSEEFPNDDGKLPGQAKLTIVDGHAP